MRVKLRFLTSLGKKAGICRILVLKNKSETPPWSGMLRFRFYRETIIFSRTILPAAGSGLPGHFVIIFRTRFAFAAILHIVFRLFSGVIDYIISYISCFVGIFGIAVLRFPLGLTTIELFIVEVRHQVGFHVIDHLGQ